MRKKLWVLLGLLILITFYFFNSTKKEIVVQAETSSQSANESKQTQSSSNKITSLRKAENTDLKNLKQIDEDSVAERKSAICAKKLITEHDLKKVLNNFKTDITKSLSPDFNDWFIYQSSILPAETKNSKIDKFFYALALANLLGGARYSAHFNETKAISLLEEVAEIDPENSASLVFMAIIYDRQKNKPRVENLINIINSRTIRFDTYMMEIRRRLISIVKSPEEFLAITNIFTNHPVPNMLVVENFAIKHSVDILADQLTADALNTNNTVSDYQWWPLDYSVGVAISEKLRPGFKVMKYRDLIKQKEELSEDTSFTALSNYYDTCSIKYLESYILQVRRKILN